jgi:hypothetical protein
MVKIFGEKIDGLDYQIRKGVYAIVFNSEKDKILTVRNYTGHYFLPGEKRSRSWFLWKRIWLIHHNNLK